ncbi:MAG: RdgB/HAM1 family non-canonical purine NTP pyrophosphatase [Bryobacteraceae bacterium]
MKLWCATGNAGKLREFRRAAAEAGIEVDGLPDFKEIPECVEDGVTFVENAILKARHYAPYVPGPVFADDSGLVVDALNGAPGVYSARFAGLHATDEDNNRLLLERLRGVHNRSARFVCVIALVEGGEVRGLYEAAVEGEMLDAPRGAGGFGYDPLFYYRAFDCTFGEASEEQKLAVSHRGQAFRKMLREAMRMTGGPAGSPLRIPPPE